MGTSAQFLAHAGVTQGGHKGPGEDKHQERFADGNGLSFPGRASLGTASMGKQPDPHAPKDVIVSSICWCLPPSPGFHLPAALYSNANMLPTLSCSMGKALVISSPGRHPHVHAVPQDTGLGARRYLQQRAPKIPLSSASILTHVQGFWAHWEPCLWLTALCSASGTPTMLFCSPKIFPPVLPPLSSSLAKDSPGWSCLSRSEGRRHWPWEL